MDIESLPERLKRLGYAVAYIAAALFIVIRGQTCSDSSFIIPLMCTFAALPLAITGFMLALRAEAQTE